MKTHLPLQPILDACRADPDAWPDSYVALIARLTRAGVGAAATVLGAEFPDFALPDLDGRLHRLSDLAQTGPVVISFNRGSWCPFCEAEVAAWAERLEELAVLGARLVIVTPETGGRMAGLAARAGPRATVLCDADLGLALRMGLAFPVGAEVMQILQDDGLDLAVVNGSANGFLPVPATFVLDWQRRVRFAYAQPDFSRRADPQAVLAAVAALTSAPA